MNIPEDVDLYLEGVDPFSVDLNFNIEELLFEGEPVVNDYGLCPNQRYMLETNQGTICIKVSSDNIITKYNLKSQYSGIEGCDLHQKIALDMMNDTDIKLVSCLGLAGTGKTFITLATVFKMLVRDSIEKVFFIKPLTGVSKSKFLGALPGGLDEKVAPFLESFYDVAYSLGQEQRLEGLLAQERIQFVPVDFIRGRNLDNCVLIVDEVQNLDRHDLLAVLTRIGKNGRVILLGDPNPQQNDIRHDSGLASLIDDPRFWDSPHTSCIHLKKRMRNPIVELVETILMDI